MVIFKKVEDLQAYLLKIKEKGQSVGFVPTMGALHEGHLSLLQQAENQGDFTVVSIFVNPTQFNDKADFEKYPITLDKDKELLIATNCGALFIPSVAEVYPAGPENTPAYGFGYLETVLEGAHRPGHFKGVGQVVARLLEMVQADKLYLGQKDYQQCMVLKSLLGQVPAFNNIHLHIGNTRREADGLAMSSRNTRLTPPQRALAPLLYQCLVSIQAKQGIQSFDIVQKECLDILKDKGFTPEYVSLADADTLELMNDYQPGRKTVALIATKIGDIRLIDNLVL